MVDLAEKTGPATPGGLMNFRSGSLQSISLMSRWSARMDFGTAYPQTAVAVGVDNQLMPLHGQDHRIPEEVATCSQLL